MTESHITFAITMSQIRWYASTLTCKKYWYTIFYAGSHHIMNLMIYQYFSYHILLCMSVNCMHVQQKWEGSALED